MKKQFKQTIKTHLDNRASTDELFAVSYAKENKSLDECIAYIMGEARKLGSEVCVSDDVVFGWAVHYYDEDDIEINKTIGKVKQSTAPEVELSEEEKAKILEEAKAQYKQIMVDKLIAAEKAKEATKAKDLANKRKEREKELQEAQMSIFDVL